jgi:zinc D-Ala-D-Ala carboxypeptidase
MQLTKHFSLAELNPLGLNVPPAILANLKVLAQQLEHIRTALGNRPINVTSGYRSRAVELRHGRAGNSRHTLGEAADITVSGMNPDMVQRALSWWPGGLGLANTFTHIDIRHISTLRPTTHQRVRWRY